MSLVAYVLGARVLEKHFTLNRAWKGTDHAFSLEPEGMRKLVRDVRRAGLAMGDGVKRVYDKEQPARIKMGRRSSPPGTCRPGTSSDRTISRTSRPATGCRRIRTRSCMARR